MKTHYVIPCFIPHYACPFTCIFCNQNKISGAKHRISPQEIKTIISRYLKTIPERDTYVEVGFFGGNFTGLPLKMQRAYLASTQVFLKKGEIHGVRISTRPDCIDQGVLNTLKSYHVQCIELGIQSMFNDVLKASKRGYTRADVKSASTLIIKNGFALGHQIMVGLPKSTFKKELLTAKMSIDLKASIVRIYPTLVIKGTALSVLWERKLYASLDEDEAIRRCAKLIILLEKNGINVIRCGLHPSLGLLTGSDILDGPFHQAFRQKVETYIYGNIFRQFLQRKKMAQHIRRVLFNPEEAAYIIGYKRANANYVETALGKHNIFAPNASVPTRQIIVECVNGELIKLNKFD